MILKSFELLKDENGEIIGVPVLDGKFTMIKITKVDGDDPDENDERELVYDPETGELANNYILAYVVKLDSKSDKDEENYSVAILNSGAEICSMLGIGAAHGNSVEYINTLNKFALDLSASTNVGSPVYVVPIKICVGVPTDGEEPEAITTLVVMNKLEVLKEAGTKDNEKNARYNNMLQKNPGIEESIKNHVMVKGYLGKMTEFIQRSYNKSSYEDGVDAVAKYISNITIFDDRGQIVPMTVSSLENFITSIKNKIYLG